MEQSIIDFASQQEIFCAEFKRSLDAEVERRHSDLGGVSASLSKMLETQLQTVGKLSNLATNQLYAEQKWVTTYLKNARNEADKESTAMQKFLTENLLILLQQVDASLQDQTKTLESLKQGISIAFNNIIADRNEFLHNQRKMLLTANNKVKAFSQLQISEMRAISEREEKLKRSELQFGERFVEAKKKIDSLLSSLFSEYDSYSSLANKTSEANSRNLASSSARQEQMTSLIDVALTQATDTSAVDESELVLGPWMTQLLAPVTSSQPSSVSASKGRQDASPMTGAYLSLASTILSWLSAPLSSSPP